MTHGRRLKAINMKHTRLVTLFIVLLILSSAATILIYGHLPEQIAMRWNADGELISSGPRYTLIFTALLPLFTLWLLSRTPVVHSGGVSREKHQKIYSLAVAFFLWVLIGIHWLIILFNLGVFIRTDTIVKIIIGIAFMVIGSQLEDLPFGYSIGIRTPWSISSPYNWKRTHRFAAKLFFIGGVVFLAVSPLPGRSSFWIATAVILAIVVLLYYYSYSLAKRE